MSDDAGTEDRQAMEHLLDQIDGLNDEVMLLRAQVKAAKNKYDRLARRNPALAKELDRSSKEEASA